MNRRIALTTLVVADYDEAIRQDATCAAAFCASVMGG